MWVRYHLFRCRLCPVQPCPAQPCPALSSLVQPASLFFPYGVGFVCLIVYYSNKSPLTSCIWVVASSIPPDTWQSSMLVILLTNHWAYYFQFINHIFNLKFRGSALHSLTKKSLFKCAISILLNLKWESIFIVYFYILFRNGLMYFFSAILKVSCKYLAYL